VKGLSEERREEPRAASAGPASPAFSPETEEQYVRMFTRIMERFGVRAPGLSALPVQAEALKPSEEDERVIEEFMQLMDEEIEKYAKDLIRMEVRDKILSRGPAAIEAIREALRKGKKPKLKRKKGCIFIQFGEGTPQDPIEEMLIAST